jgi:hypothetical protein
MKIKKEYIILVLIIAALCVYLVMRRSDRTLYQLPDVPQVSQKEITRVQITKGKTAIVINKQGSDWYIAPAEYPADAAKVKAMLDNVEKLTLTALVSESGDYNRYELSADQKINVKAWKGDELKRDIDVGKTAPSFRHTFVRTAGDDRVFHAQGNFRNAFDLTVDDLRDKTVLEIKPEDIQQIQITKENQSLTFTRTQPPTAVEAPEAEKSADKKASQDREPVWQSADGRAVDASALNRILKSLADLRCEGFIDDRKKEDFTAPLISLLLKGAQEYRLSIFAKIAEKDSGSPAISSASDYPFILSENQVARLMKAPSEILKTDETAPGPQKPETEGQKE